MKKINFLIQISATIFCLYIFIITAITPRSSTGLLQCFKLSNIQERQGCQTVILIKQTIDQLQKKIDQFLLLLYSKVSNLQIEIVQLIKAVMLVKYQSQHQQF